MPESTTNSGETTPTGVLTPSTVVDCDVNMSDSTNSNHYEPKTDDEILQLIAKLRLGLSESTRRLISPIPDVTKQHPAIGTVTLSQTKDIDRPTITSKLDIPYVTSQDVSTAKPAIVTAIKGFSKPHSKHDLSLFVTPTNQRESTFDMHFTRLTGHSLTYIDVDWLEIPEEHVKSGMWQHGECYLNFKEAKHPRRLSRKIKFPQPFTHPPKVVVWMSGLYTAEDNFLRIRCRHEKVEKDEFEAYCATWCDTKLHAVKLSWVAYDSSLKGVYTKMVSTEEFRSWKESQHYNTRYTAFPAGQFTKAPKVMVGVTLLDEDCGNDYNIKVFPSDITHLGMCWNANSWGNTTNYNTGLTYLAIEDWES